MPMLLMTSRRNHLLRGSSPRLEIPAVIAAHKETGKTTYESGAGGKA